MATRVSDAERPGMEVRRRPRRLETETKHALKTTELWVYIATVVGILVASWVVTTGNGGSTGDAFRASQAWLYVTIATVGYLASRGLAKSGSRDPYWSDGDDR